MNILKKNISIKYLYLISAFILVIMSLVIYSTYAMFTANTTSSNVVSLEAGSTYEFTINGTQNFSIGAYSMAAFNISVNNTASGSIYYEIYYSSSDNLTDVTIAELVEDKTITTNAPNTSGNLVNEGTKVVPIVISNNTNSTKTITVGVTSGFVGNTITYGTNGYPSGTKITSTYNMSDATTGCDIIGGSKRCIMKYQNGELTNVTCLPYIDSSNANAPVLADGMIPIMYDTTKSSWVIADYYDETSEYAGYDYQNKKWANAVMVTTETRETYMNAIPGTPVLEADILAYYVWIPRYRYQLFNASFLETSPQTISIAFESKNTTKSTGTTNETWLTHPAFTFGDQELTGFWIGKFEVSSDITCTAGNNLAVGEGCNLTTINPRIKPGVTSWVGAMISTYYLSTFKMDSTNYLTSEGVNTADVHVLKNMEWGAVAYLSHSIYGKNARITTNGVTNNSSYCTGGGPGTAYITNVDQSTTGNITGVYDMSGGSWEYAMGVIEDGVGTEIPMSGRTLADNYHSGFTGNTTSGYVTGVPVPNHKYYDLYAYGTTYDDQAAYNRSKLGDAKGETRGWYNTTNEIVIPNFPWAMLGGDGEFAFSCHAGHTRINTSTRFSMSVE